MALPVISKGKPVESLGMLVDRRGLLLREELVVQVLDTLAVAELTPEPVPGSVAAFPDVDEVAG